LDAETDFGNALLLLARHHLVVLAVVNVMMVSFFAGRSLVLVADMLAVVFVMVVA
jgi:hypothetical protein